MLDVMKSFEPSPQKEFFTIINWKVKNIYCMARIRFHRPSTNAILYYFDAIFIYLFIYFSYVFIEVLSEIYYGHRGIFLLLGRVKRSCKCVTKSVQWNEYKRSCRTRWFRRVCTTQVIPRYKTVIYQRC